MNERSAGILLQLALITNLITAQIFYPDDRRYFPASQNQESFGYPTYVQNNEELITDLTAINLKTAVNPRYQENPEEIIAHSVSKVLLDINRVVPTISPHLARADNIVYGPVTITAALSLVLLGSIGKTYNEIVNFMGLSSGINIQSNPSNYHEQVAKVGAKLATNLGIDIGQEVTFATAIFVQHDFPVRLAYQQACADIYQGNIMNLDFRGNPEMAQNVINTWIAGRTNNKIPNLLDDAPPQDTRAIIVAVLYFQAAWQFPFFDGHTKWRPFYANGRRNPSTRMAEMMSNGGEFPYYKDTTLGLEIMGFPYKGRQTTMYVIVPNDSNKENLRRLENSLTPNDIDRLVNSTVYTEVVTLFPKMKLETTINLKTVLQRLGVNTLFDPYEANLALLSPGINQGINAADAPFVSPPISASSSNNHPLNTPPNTNNNRPPNTNNNRPPNTNNNQPPNTNSNRPPNTNNNRPPNTNNNQSPNTNSNRPPNTNNNGPPNNNRPISYPSSNVRPTSTTSNRNSQRPISSGSNIPRPPPQYQQENIDDRLIFTRFGSNQASCVQVIDPVTNTSKCQEVTTPKETRKGGRAVPLSTQANLESLESLDALRQQLNQNPRLANPGVYADQIIHKVYIDITESGTEAASATGISLNRSGGRVTFRVDVPFVFFIYHESTKVILFWGSVKTPTPSVAAQ